MSHRSGATHQGGAAWTEGWESPVAIGTAGDAVVNTEGVLLAAVSGGKAANQTVNGVLFAGVTIITGYSSAYWHADVYKDGGVGAEFQDVLDGFSYANSGTPTVTLAGLTVGKWYLAQVFWSDDRGGSKSNTFTIGANTSSPLTVPQSMAVVCRFLAAATSANLVCAVVAGTQRFLNAYQLRQLD